MTEERTTETKTPEGNTHTHTTVVTDKPQSGGAGKWIGLLVLIVVAIVGVLVFSRMSDAEITKDSAVAEAAGQVGEAADQVGDAAQDAVDEISD